MERSKKVVLAFLNSAEGYFHTKTVLEDKVKKPIDSCDPRGRSSERWNYLDIRDLSKQDFENIISCALNSLDFELYNIIPSTALNAALGMVIQDFNNGMYDKKIDANTYLTLLKVLAIRAQSKGNI
jgi:hypothetical protein